MLTKEGEHIIQEIERSESFRVVMNCYSCGIAPEYHGGLCVECLIGRNIEC